MRIKHSKFKFISSLEKVLFDFSESVPEKKNGSMFKNEIYSFQLAAYFETFKDWTANCTIEIESELKDYIKMYHIGYVPSMLPAYPHDLSDDYYITKSPSLLPDVMNEMYDNTFKIHTGRAGAVWFAVEPKGKISGTYDINVKVYEEVDGLVGEMKYTLKIIDKELPEQKLINTGWFHGDCLAALHNVEIGSDKYYKIVEKYIDVYVKFGHNMIYTTLFTPPLDTDVGAERPTNQLIDVEIKDGKYIFGFVRLNHWIDICHKHGIKYFEFSHLFTQWGGKFAPKIMATVDGEYKRIFGWDAEALSKEYVEFLDAFLPLLVSFLKEKGVYENSFFHASDEPNETHAEQYEKISGILKKYVEDDHRIEALSRYEFYEKGYISKPVVPNERINPFLDHGVKNLWVYYCCMEGNKVSNRFMAMPSYRNRILGVQLYKNEIEGFLQWGFNFWFSRRSKRVINPYCVTDGEMWWPSGDPFIVYPLDEKENVVTSLRLYVFNDGLQDMRALQLLESLSDRQTVDKFIEDVVRFDTYPKNSEYILNLRENINKKIEELLNK